MYIEIDGNIIPVKNHDDYIPNFGCSSTNSGMPCDDEPIVLKPEGQKLFDFSEGAESISDQIKRKLKE